MEAATTGSVVVPNLWSAVDGNIADYVPFLQNEGFSIGRYQQLYDASEFPEETSSISGIALRWDAEEGGPTTPTILHHVELILGISDKGVPDLSEILDENIYTTPITVFEGSITLPADQGADSPRPFDIVFPFDTEFEYDPSLGNLVLEVRNYNGPQVTEGKFDFCKQAGGSVGAVFVTNVDDLYADGLGSQGLVTKFLFSSSQPTPEPTLVPTTVSPSSSPTAVPSLKVTTSPTNPSWPPSSVPNNAPTAVPTASLSTATPSTSPSSVVGEPSFGISKVVLVNSATNGDLQVLGQPRSVVNHAIVGKFLSVRVDTIGDIKEVVFAWDGEEIRTERYVPLVLGGDYNGRYSTFQPLSTTGTYTLDVIVTAVDGKSISSSVILDVVDEGPALHPDRSLSCFLWEADGTPLFNLLEAPEEEYPVMQGDMFSVEAFALKPLGSVCFDLDEQENVWTENMVPYFLGGDNQDKSLRGFGDLTAVEGKHTLVARAYSGSNCNGALQDSYSVDFLVQKY